MEYIIIWIVCGIGAAAIASSKGRSAGAWFLGGLLLGPIGLLIVGFMGAPAPSVSSVRKCPFCAETILREAKVCKHMPGNAAGAMNSPKSNIPSAPIRTALNPEGIQPDDASTVSESEKIKQNSM